MAVSVNSSCGSYSRANCDDFNSTTCLPATRCNHTEQREIRSENAVFRPDEHSFDLLTDIVADEEGCFYMNPFRSVPFLTFK